MYQYSIRTAGDKILFPMGTSLERKRYISRPGVDPEEEKKCMKIYVLCYNISITNRN